MKNNKIKNDEKQNAQLLADIITKINKNGVIAGTGDQIEEVQNAKRRTDRPA